MRSNEHALKPLYKAKFTQQTQGDLARFSFFEPGWHYGWRGRRFKHTIYHVLRLYLFKVEGQDLRLISVEDSPQFSIVSSRTWKKNKTMPPGHQDNMHMLEKAPVKETKTNKEEKKTQEQKVEEDALPQSIMYIAKELDSGNIPVMPWEESLEVDPHYKNFFEETKQHDFGSGGVNSLEDVTTHFYMNSNQKNSLDEFTILDSQKALDNFDDIFLGSMDMLGGNQHKHITPPSGAETDNTETQMTDQELSEEEVKRRADSQVSAISSTIMDIPSLGSNSPINRAFSGNSVGDLADIPSLSSGGNSTRSLLGMVGGSGRDLIATFQGKFDMLLFCYYFYNAV